MLCRKVREPLKTDVACFSTTLKFDEKGNIIRPARKTVSVLNEGNLAFKCTYNDNGYRGVCSDRIYRHNIDAKRVWCNDRHNECREYVGKALSKNDSPCYESTLFLNWAFGAGVKRGEKYYGIPFSIKKARQGKLAFLTTRDPLQDERDRHIFGFLHIKNIDNIKDLTNKDVMAISEFVIGDPEHSLEIQPSARLKFWNYYKNPYSPDNISWNSGLFRYLSDASALRILNDLKKEYEKTNDEKALKIIDFNISRYEK